MNRLGAAAADTILALVQGGHVLARADGDRGSYDGAVRGAVTLVGLAPDQRGR